MTARAIALLAAIVFAVAAATFLVAEALGLA